MVNKCIAAGCRSGYVSQKSSHVRITLHSFPRDKEWRDKWIRANPRKDFAPTKNSKMCSLHFAESDFVDEHRDSNSHRRKKHSWNAKLRRRYLKRDAVPSFFPDAPAADLSLRAPTHRSSAAAAAASSRLEWKTTKIEFVRDTLEAEDSVTSLTAEQMTDKLVTESALPRGFQLSLIDGMLVIYRLQIDESVPEVQASVTVAADLTVVVALNHKQVAPSRYRDLVPGSLQTVSQLLAVVTRINDWCNDIQPTPTDLTKR